MLFSKYFKSCPHLDRRRFADLALALRPDDAHALGTRDWAFANIRSFKAQLKRLDRSLAFVNDEVISEDTVVSSVGYGTTNPRISS